MHQGKGTGPETGRETDSVCKTGKKIQDIIIDKNPDQLKMPFALWTRAAVTQLIHDKLEIDVSLRTISNYLKRWGMTCQRPAKRAYRQDVKKLKEFMEETYPKIYRKAKVENADIYWADETGINNQEYYVRGFSARGRTPVIPSFPKIEKINMISAISSNGKCRFMCYRENMTQQRFIDFMRRLVNDSDRKVMLIVDNLRVHHGKIVMKWLGNHTKDIEIFYTSPYSPEINPDEYLNHNLKIDVHSGILPRTAKDLHRKTYSFMRRLQNDKSKVQNIFKHRNLSYITKQAA